MGWLGGVGVLSALFLMINERPWPPIVVVVAPLSSVPTVAGGLATLKRRRFVEH